MLSKSSPDIRQVFAMPILFEFGNDLSAFKTSSNLIGRAGFRSRNGESAGKIKSRKTMHGNKFLRIILVQCAWTKSLSKNFHYKNLIISAIKAR
ncbi:MAG: transposase [Prevotellaceae bacterium]|nr:transposase [Prevotellaceae bacterium]